VTADDLIRIERELASGQSTVAALAAELGVAPWTVTRARRRHTQRTEVDTRRQSDETGGRGPLLKGDS
jgi:transposase-like protein